MNPEMLVRQALQAREQAYAPYSHFAVGAALLLRDGRVVRGANVENASFGLTVCAERIAVFKAITEGSREFAALAVATARGASMCGACRQVLREFAPTLPIYLADATGAFRTHTLQELLPESFGPESLEPAPPPG